MALKYFATVHDVAVQVNGKEKLVKKGDAAPDGIDVPVRDALVRMGLLTASEAPQRRGAGDDTATAPAEPETIVIDSAALPAEKDSRKVWEAFGAKVVDLSADDAKALKTKDDLVAEVTKRFNDRSAS